MIDQKESFYVNEVLSSMSLINEMWLEINPNFRNHEELKICAISILYHNVSQAKMLQNPEGKIHVGIADLTLHIFIDNFLQSSLSFKNKTLGEIDKISQGIKNCISLS